MLNPTEYAKNIFFTETQENLRITRQTNFHLQEEQGITEIYSILEKLKKNNLFLKYWQTNYRTRQQMYKKNGGNYIIHPYVL